MILSNRRHVDKDHTSWWSSRWHENADDDDDDDDGDDDVIAYLASLKLLECQALTLVGVVSVFKIMTAWVAFYDRNNSI